MANFIVVNNLKKWQLNIPGVEIVSARDYLTGSRFSEVRGAKIFNLCRYYRYQTNGYYVSLLAAARGHRAFPSINTILDMKSVSVVRVLTEDLDRLIQQSLSAIQSDRFVLSIYFGKNMSKRYDPLSQRIFRQFQAPFLRVFFWRKGAKWKVRNIQLISLNDVPDEHLPYVVEFAKQYFSRSHFQTRKRRHAPYDMAILLDEHEIEPPSDRRAIESFIRAGEKTGFSVEIISKDDYDSIPEFHALFIRETTNINHHTVRFAQRAEAEGLVVIDDPGSILKCANKVYLAELLNHYRIPTPQTVVISKENVEDVLSRLYFPVILKQPDSSYSQGVLKVESVESYLKTAEMLLDKSDLIIAQEFMPTEFDWRIGVLNREPIYACKYYMARNHWQVGNWKEKGKKRYGNWETFRIEDVPKTIVRTAVRAANLIGDGLYGVDLKTIGNRCYVIEVNDNPNVDTNIEDKVLKDELYLRIMQEFFDRIQKKSQWKKSK
jgi:glutathione synthase/RimK-type ligase-like ATP-grasp enzyme